MKKFKTKEYYKNNELIYSAEARCDCGAGLAYPKDCNDPKHYWDCSDILTGRAKKKDEKGSIKHCGKLSFIYYEIKSENQPSAFGATTRNKIK